MRDLKRLGKNIRSLRQAFGESQEELASAVNSSKSAISFYENGQREPTAEVLAAIATHYSTTVEDLKFGDLSFFESELVSFDENVVVKNIHLLFPIVKSSKALENELFKKAYDEHHALYERIKHGDGIDYEEVDDCLTHYYRVSTGEHNHIFAELSANIIGLSFLLMLLLKNFPQDLRNRPAYLEQLATRNKDLREVIGIDKNNLDTDFVNYIEEDAKDTLSFYEDEEWEGVFYEMLKALKKSKSLSELADYYLALRYAWNFVDNGLSKSINQTIGNQMLNDYAMMKNRFVIRFLNIIVKQFGLQTVADKN